MTEQQTIELREYLKKNLKVEVSVYGEHDEPLKTVRVVILLEGEVLDSDSDVG